MVELDGRADDLEQVREHGDAHARMLGAPDHAQRLPALGGGGGDDDAVHVVA